MDLKSLIAKKRKETSELMTNGAKFVKRSDLEAARSAKLRDEEARELEAKALRKAATHPTTTLTNNNTTTSTAATTTTTTTANAIKQQEDRIASLTHAQLIRRLRLLGQPATLFGEDDDARRLRLVRAEAELEVDDELKGGQQQANVLLQIQREEEERLKRERLLKTEAREGGGGGGGEGGVVRDARDQPTHPTTSGRDPTTATATTTTNTTNTTSSQPTTDAFARAAILIQEQLDEESMCIEDKCLKYLQKWCDAWRADLDARPPEIAASAAGRKASDEYLTTHKSFHHLFHLLATRSLPSDVKRGISIMVQCMKERNYLHADAVLLNAIAIGNAPWPIGVTQVGIHTKSAGREKISSKNSNAAAHIMTDEATRKYLHGLKRLLTTMQRLYPTDPSRSIEFAVEGSVAQGMSGAGSGKQALLNAEARGDEVRPAPSRSLLQYNEDGTVRVPEKLTAILRGGGVG